MESSIQFWNKRAVKYAKRPVTDQDAYLQKIKVTQHYLHCNMDVLEFGCGTGSTAILHAPKVRNYLATDASEKMIEIGKRKLVATGIDNLEFKVAEIHDLLVEKESYDAILGLNILHLLHDPIKMVSDG